MNYKLEFFEEATNSLNKLKKFDEAKYKKIVKALHYMETNLRHPSLNTHQYKGYSSPQGKEVYESYVENQTPGAYRIFWYYGPERRVITILSISPHP